MSEAFEPLALIVAVAPLLGLKLAPEQLAPVETHLRIAAEMAAKLDRVSLDDEDEPAPVFSP